MKTPYEQLVQTVDALVKQLAQRYAAHLACRAGCSGCCQHHLSVFPVEAACIETALVTLPVGLRARLEQQASEVKQRETSGEPVACPMLVDERCAIYSARPLICRTQGLPLLFEAEDGAQEVDFCPLNFTTAEAQNELDEEHLVPLDEVNTRLALANLQHCRATGIPDQDSAKRQRMSDIILNSRT